MTEKQNFLLHNLWYYALPGKKLKPGAMLKKTLLGEPVLLGRSRGGKVFALRDICPHRGIPLSCGRFDGEEVECCYHGWRFDTKGSCTAIPALVEDKDFNFSRFDVRTYPVKEVQGNVWLYMAETEQDNLRALEEDIPLVPEFGNQTYNFEMTMHFPCHVDHAVIGLMDPAHSPFVHRAWWWRSAETNEEARAFDPSPYGFTMRKHHNENLALGYSIIGGAPEVEISFQLPGVRIENITNKRHKLSNLTAVTPLSDQETEVTFLAYWDIPWLNPLKPVLKFPAQAFLKQDRDVVIKQQEGLKYEPSLTLIHDADTQAIWYYRLKAEFVKSREENRPFVNPVKGRVLRWRG